MTFLHVVIPAYGDSPYLYEAIESVVNSVDINTPITVLDDGLGVFTPRHMALQAQGLRGIHCTSNESQPTSFSYRNLCKLAQKGFFREFLTLYARLFQI